MLKSRSARISTWEENYITLFRTIYLPFEARKGNQQVSHLILWSALVPSSQCPCHNQDRLDGTQPPVIVILMRDSKDE